MSPARDFTFNFFFSGNGVHIYIVDDGVDTSSTEFTGRVGEGAAFVNAYPGTAPYQPVDSHGTMMAGVAAGTTYGVAKAANIHSVRIGLSHDLVGQDIVAGLDWIKSRVAQHPTEPAVVNFSLWTRDTTVRNALSRLINAGIPVVKAAGNNNMDACTDDVANPISGIIVVGATDRWNSRWPYSDYGPCVSVFAPGVDVQSIGLNGAPETSSSTSIATPFVTGTAAAVIQQEATKGEYGPLAPWRTYNLITLSATMDSVRNAMGSPNRLLNSLHRYVYPSGPPSDIYSDRTKTVTWTMRFYGGDGNWSNYFWEVKMLPNGVRTVVSTSPTYSRTIQAGSQNSFMLYMTATSFGRSTTDSLPVAVHKPSTLCNPVCPQ